MIKIGRKRGEVRCVAEHRSKDPKETAVRIATFLEVLKKAPADL